MKNNDIRIANLMEKGVCTCQPDDSLAEAAGAMLKGDVGALPVLDCSDKLIGMITDRDICMSGLIEGQALKDLPVSLAASTPAWSCLPEDSLDDVRATMETHRIYRVPVVDKEDRLVGIIGLGDLVRATMNKENNSSPRDLAQTLSTIMEPREHNTPVGVT